MTQIIERCFDSNISVIRKRKQSNQFQQFLKQTFLELKRNLIKINDNTYTITFSSKAYQSKIKYSTILNVFESHVNIKIIPLDQNGCIIRSKQSFNKNGWIRKHINENKNKYLKISPLSGQVYFMYSCFMPQRMRIGIFWSEVLSKISNIQGQLPQLLSKIINIQGRQGTQYRIDQAIQTNKLVLSIKLSQLMRQNMRIQDQFNNITKFQLSKYSNQGYKDKQKIKHYTINNKPLQQLTINKSILQQISKDYLFNIKLLQSNSFRIGKSNLTSLTLSKQDQQKLKNKTRFMNYRQQTRFKIQQFNREMFIIIKKQDQQTTRNLKKLLRQLGQDVQYLFLDNFLQQNVLDDIIMTVALKQVTLNDYLWKNFQTISYQTKFRILLQTFNSISTLWMKNNISFQSLNIHSFTVTKNLQVKMKKLQNAKYIHPCRLQNEQAFLINNQRKQILKQFSNIYFDIFFNKKSPSIRAQKMRIKNQQQYKQQDMIFESLNELTKFYYPNNLFTLIIGLNYFFIQMYWKNLQKSNTIIKPDDQIVDFGGWKGQTQQVSEYYKQLDQAKKGGPRIDLILAMCIQFLQEHQSKYPIKGGQM